MQLLCKYCKIMVFRDSNHPVKIRVGRFESGKMEKRKLRGWRRPGLMLLLSPFSLSFCFVGV